MRTTTNRRTRSTAGGRPGGAIVRACSGKWLPVSEPGQSERRSLRHHRVRYVRRICQLRSLPRPVASFGAAYGSLRADVQTNCCLREKGRHKKRLPSTLANVANGHNANSMCYRLRGMAIIAGCFADARWATRLPERSASSRSDIARPDGRDIEKMMIRKRTPQMRGRAKS